MTGSLSPRKRWERRARVALGVVLSFAGFVYMLHGYFALTGNAAAFGAIAAGFGLCYLAELLTRGCFR